MTEHRDRQPGDLILDHYLPDATPEQREEARVQLYDFVAWQLRIIMRQLREETDSRAGQERATLDSAQQPP